MTFVYEWKLMLLTNELRQINLTNTDISVKSGKYLKVNRIAFELNMDYMI